MTKKPNPAQLEFPFMETKTTITSRSQDAADGGVYVDPADRSKIYLFVKGYLVPAFLEES
jgi:hypothetical protein